MITLTDICGELRNYFIHGVGDIHTGTFKISDGYIQPLDFLQEGQYYRICGSTFNDGVWIYPFDGLRNETFTGSVWAMSVPPDVIALTDEIDKWVADNGGAISSPYQSESFDGYSYSKGSSGVSSGAASAITWQGQFNTRLSRWRKLREI